MPLNACAGRSQSRMLLRRIPKASGTAHLQNAYLQSSSTPRLLLHLARTRCLQQALHKSRSLMVHVDRHPLPLRLALLHPALLRRRRRPVHWQMVR